LLINSGDEPELLIPTILYNGFSLCTEICLSFLKAPLPFEAD